MAISLQKGQKVSLEKLAPSLKVAFIGLGWDVNPTDTGDEFDLDASAFILGTNEKLLSEEHFIFYNNLKDPEDSVKLMGDNRTGEGSGDDEVIIVELRKVSEEVKRIVITVTIHEAGRRKQNFGQVRNAFVRLVDVESKEEVLRYDLAEDYSIETALIMTELYRKDGQWRINAVGEAYQGGLQALLDRYQ